MVNGLREWASAARLIEGAPLKQLENRTIGIDAEDYIDKILNSPQTREPLLSALGGNPFTIDTILAEHLAVFKEAKITPFFVFNGLRINAQQMQLHAGLAHSQNVGEAWDLYNASDPERAVAKFGSSSLFKTAHIYRHVQEFLVKNDTEFLVAPYSACAQLASMEGTDFANAVAGSTELLLFPVERVILDFDMTQKQFTWITRQCCIDELGLGSSDQLVDACLFAGSSFLPTLPPLRDEAMHGSKAPKIRAAADLLSRMGMNGNDLVTHFRDAPAMQAMDYGDQYRRALMSLRHHVTIKANGKVEPFNKDAVPNDVHAFIGQHLPDELLFYLSRGIIGTRLPIWRTAGEILESPPLDGGVAGAYRNLVQTKLNNDRLQALSLLSYCLHRFYQHNNLTLRCWFDMEHPKVLNVIETTDPKTLVHQWNVRIDAISQRAKALNRNVSSLGFALESLRDASFAKSTLTKQPSLDKGEKPLSNVDEVHSNVLWRYLHLRGYTTSAHELSDLGLSLAAGASRVPAKHAHAAEMTESVVLALEMLRLGVLNSDANMFPAPPYYGAPFRGSSQDQQNTLLVSRVACLGRLAHKSIGYTGPLSRHLLAFHSVVAAVRDTQRDLVEMSLASLLLTGSVDRKMSVKDLQSIAFRLPFMHSVDCALAIAVKHYLDELSGLPDATSAEARQGVKEKGRVSWFPHAVDFDESLAYAFGIWDAVAAAVKIAPDSIVSAAQKKQWAGVNEWLSTRR